MILPVEIAVLVFAIIGMLFLGLFTLLKNSKSITNRLFIIFTLSVSFYLLTNFISLHPGSQAEQLWWINVVMAGVGTMNFFFFLLVLAFPKTKQSLSKKMVLGGSVLTILLIIASLTNFIFPSVKVTNGNIQPSPGPGMLLFVIHMIIFLFGGVWLLFRKYRKALGTERKQTFLFLLGTLFMYGATILSNFVLVLAFKVSILVGFLPLYALIFVGCISYAIVKHQFLDITLLVARGVSFILLVFFVAIFYSLGILLLGVFIFDLRITIVQQFALVGITVITAVTFQRVQRLIEKSTNRFLFKDRYNTDEEITALTRIMASTFILDELITKILEKLQGSLKFTKGGFVVFSKEGKAEIKPEAFSLSDEAITRLKKFEKLIVFDDLEEGEDKQLLRTAEISVVSPLKTKDELVGIMIFGGKQSGERYTEQDLQFLAILSDESAVAIQNARSYEEIKRFNVTLQEEVEKATRDLKEANVQLQELDKLKDEFVSLASHELRTPMSAIKGSLSTILEGYAGDISTMTREFLTAAYNENDRLIRLVNNLLNTSRIESGRLSFSLNRVNLSDIMTEVVKNLQMAAKEKNLFLRYEPFGFLPQVLIDEDKIKEVIINLIGNATKFTTNGGITIKTTVEGEFVVTSVEDTGTGIHKEDFDLLFKKFSQVKTQYTKTIGGTGLGLYISKKIIEGLGGKIWLDSEVGKGTTFYFSLPIAK